MKRCVKAKEEKENGSSSSKLIRKYWEEYKKETTFLDYGDDPSFFCSKYFHKDLKHVSWGVCRPDVRREVKDGDAVIFFCGVQNQNKKLWRYYLIGVGVIKEKIDRRKKFRSLSRLGCSEYLNILVGYKQGELQYSEELYPGHKKSWCNRAKAPYIIFHGKKSKFNLKNPKLVAIYKRGANPPERWLRSKRSAREIEKILFVENGIKRRLRTGRTQNAHPKLNLNRKSDRPIDEEKIVSAVKRLI